MFLHWGLVSSDTTLEGHQRLIDEDLVSYNHFCFKLSCTWHLSGLAMRRLPASNRRCYRPAQYCPPGPLSNPEMQGDKDMTVPLAETYAPYAAWKDAPAHLEVVHTKMIRILIGNE